MARFDPPGSALGTPTPHADPAASGGGEAGGRGRCYHTSTTTQGGGRGRRPVYIGGHRSGLPLPLSAGVGSSHPIGSMASGQVTHPVRLDRPPLSDRGPVPPESLYCIGACPVVPVRLSSGPVALCLTGCGCGECCPPTHNRPSACPCSCCLAGIRLLSPTPPPGQRRTGRQLRGLVPFCSVCTRDGLGTRRPTHPHGRQICPQSGSCSFDRRIVQPVGMREA